MKLAPTFLLLAFTWHGVAGLDRKGTRHLQANGEGECTRGLLYVSDKDSTTLHVYNLTEGLDQPLTEVDTISGLPGGVGQALETTANGLHVISTYWGNWRINYQDGYVNFINTGVTAEDHGDHSHLSYAGPSVLTNIFLECGPVWHPAHHAGHIALYCDGSFADGVNTTVYVLSEEMLSEDSKDAFVYNGSIPSSHHGIAIPIDGNSLFHSLPTADRLSGIDDADFSYPDTFQVLNYEDGSIALSLNDTSIADSHCKVYHGATVVENTIYLCCEGQVLVVEYDPASETYTTRSLPFPDFINADHRCGYNTATPQSDYVVTDYADWVGPVYAPHLLAFPKDATELTDADVLVLGEEGQCQFFFEQAAAEHLVVLLPNGTLQAYSYGRPDGWMLLGEVVIPGVDSCGDAQITPGYGQVFVAVWASNTIYSVDLTHLGHDPGEIRSLAAVATEVPYKPYYLVVSGVPPGTACMSEGEPTCGDGVVDPPEECDDGNTAGGDGCSATCQVEPACPPTDFCCGKADGTKCSMGDGNKCLKNSKCMANKCDPGPPKICRAANQCHVAGGECDPSTGFCTHARKPNGTPCDDGNAATKRDVCIDGLCKQAPCTGPCCGKADGTACKKGDGNKCIKNAKCEKEVCVGSEKICNPPTQCKKTVGSCNPATGFCTFVNKPDGTPCNDREKSTKNDQCLNGKCVGTPV